MDLSNLYSGVVVVIDDEIHEKDKGIYKIVSHLESLNMPLLKYSELPNDETVKHFYGVSFIILDWQLKPDFGLDATEMVGFQIPDGLNVTQNVEFLKKVRKISYCPIFIFTDQSIEKVQDYLIQSGESVNIENQPIYIESKKNVSDFDSLNEKLTSWLKKQPAFYALKAVNIEMRKAEVKLFEKFLAISPLWPLVLYKTSKDDKSNFSFDLNDFILQYLNNTINIPDFTESIIRGDTIKDKTISEEEITKIYSGANFVEESSKERKYAMTGDLFLLNDNDNPYYLINIRPLCDTIRPRNPDIYCLKGVELEETDNLEMVQGQIIQKGNSEIVPYVGEIKAIKFKFRDLKIIKWNKIKGSLMGRVLPPFSLRIQQRYSQYLTRIGLPRVPDNYLMDSNLND